MTWINEMHDGRMNYEYIMMHECIYRKERSNEQEHTHRNNNNHKEDKEPEEQ